MMEQDAFAKTGLGVEELDTAVEQRIIRMALDSDDPRWAIAWAQMRIGSYLYCINDSLDDLRDSLQTIGRAGE